MLFPLALFAATGIEATVVTVNLRLQADAILLFFKARAFALAPDVKLSRLTEFLQKAISNCRRQRVALIFSRPLNSFDWRRQPTIDGGS